MKKSILLIYTGGTIGMIRTKNGSLIPFNFDNLKNQIPELEKFDVKLDHQSIKEPIDSSNMHPNVWIELAQIIEDEYKKYDGFVILHGSDTMAYTASALSFMLKNLQKPIVFTGSQLPIGIARTDAKENLITSIEIASQNKTPEVCIYFEYKLFRANRATKINASNFEAFASPNFPILAQAGVSIQYHSINYEKTNEPLTVLKELNPEVLLIKLHPGVNQKMMEHMVNQNIKAIIIESYGAGNVSEEKWFLSILEKCIKQQKIVVNITQFLVGSVSHGMYQTSAHLDKIGVISGSDLTTEAAITKLMVLLAQYQNMEEVKNRIQKSLCGELSG